MDKHQDENNEQNQKVPENLKFKEVLSTGITGKVKWFNVKLGYGFVCRNDNQEDIFIHQSAIVKSNPDHPRKSVEDGEEILFDVVKGNKGNEASNVTGIGGNCVKGSEYALRYPRNRGKGRLSFRGSSRRRNEPGENIKRSQDFYRGGGRPPNKRLNMPPAQVKNEVREARPPPKEKPIVLTGIRGKVKWFNVKLGYGFVCRADNNQDIFIHQTAITKSNPQHLRRSVENGEEILFDIVQGEKGYETANVSAPNGDCVKGSEYALRYPRIRGSDRSRGRGGRNRYRGASESEARMIPDFFPDNVRGRPIPMRSFRGPRIFPPGRPFRGGRGYRLPFIHNYNLDMIGPFYDFPNEFDPARMPRGGRMKRGLVREVPMDNVYFERGGPISGRPRNKGRGSYRRAGGVGPRTPMINGVHSEQEIHSEIEQH